MSYKAKHRRIPNPITGYDISCDEFGDTCYYDPRSARSGKLVQPYINENAINEIKMNFIWKNQY